MQAHAEITEERLDVITKDIESKVEALAKARQQLADATKIPHEHDFRGMLTPVYGTVGLMRVALRDDPEHFDPVGILANTLFFAHSTKHPVRRFEQVMALEELADQLGIREEVEAAVAARRGSTPPGQGGGRGA